MRNWLTVILVFLAAYAAISSDTPSDWSKLGSPTDDAKLRAILDSVGVTEAYAAEVRKSMTDTEAKDLLWQAFEAIHDKHEYADGLETLKKVLSIRGCKVERSQTHAKPRCVQPKQGLRDQHIRAGYLSLLTFGGAIRYTGVRCATRARCARRQEEHGC